MCCVIVMIGVEVGEVKGNRIITKIQNLQVGKVKECGRRGASKVILRESDGGNGVIFPLVGSGRLG